MASISEAKNIAEEGFIYGLPIVMNYAVMNEYAVNKDSGQFKAPFNQINNEARNRYLINAPFSRHEKERRRFGYAVHSEQISGCG